MAIYEYKIATKAAGVGALANLEDLGLPPPRGGVPHDPDVHWTGEGKKEGDGASVVVWTWDFLSQAHYNILRGYCSGHSAEVYIRTRKDDGTWANYLAAMHWPDDPTESKVMGQAYRNFEIEFTRLEAA